MTSSTLADSLADALQSAYGLDALEVEWIPRGLGSQNFRAVTAAGVFFVKRYSDETDFEAERRALVFGETLRTHGVRTPKLVRTRTGEALLRSPECSIALFEWTSARVVQPLTVETVEIGTSAVRKLHQVAATLDPPVCSLKRLNKWKQFRLEETTRKFVCLRDQAQAAVGSGDAFAARALEILDARLRLLEFLPGLIERCANAPTQLVHGDMSALNLLFDENGAVVVDVRPPEIYFPSFELARIAFDPETIVLQRNWLEIGERGLGAYLTAAGADAGARRVVAYTPVLWACHLLRSTYGIRQHFSSPHPWLQESLDRYFEARALALTQLLANLDLLDEMVEQLE